MKRAGLVLLLVTPTLLIVRAVVRYNEQQATIERAFGTEEERQKATAKIIESERKAEGAGALVGANETEQSCLDRGFERERNGSREYAGLMNFLQGCLRVAKSTPSFCDQVPPYRATMSPEEEARS